MARLLEVSRSGCYAWRNREPSARAVRRERIEAKIAWFHGDSDGVSGSPRILADLAASDADVRGRAAQRDDLDVVSAQLVLRDPAHAVRE